MRHKLRGENNMNKKTLGLLQYNSNIAQMLFNDSKIKDYMVNDMTALAVGLPMQLLEYMKKNYRGHFIYRPRGGTYGRTRHNCTMRDATSFSVYLISRSI